MAYRDGMDAMELLTMDDDKNGEIIISDEKNVEALKQKCKDCLSHLHNNDTATTTDTTTDTTTAMEDVEMMEEQLLVEDVTTTVQSNHESLSSVSNNSNNSNKKRKAPKYQYYQSDSMMTIAILEPDLDESQLKVDFETNRLTVIVQKHSESPLTLICGTLFDTVQVDRCKVKYMQEKVLLKLKKTSKMNWHELFGSGGNGDDDVVVDVDDVTNNSKKDTTAVSSSAPSTTTTSTTTSTSTTTTKPSPYASPKDWNAIERNLKQEEQQEKPEGEEALNKLFKDIYGKANDDTRRAMVKSFQTSGGTVLSTNWGDVKDADYEKDRVAPKGMEWKSWEGDKLKQKDS